MDSSQINMVFVPKNVELMRFMILQLINVFAFKVLAKSMEPAQSVNLEQSPQPMVSALAVVLTKNLLADNVPAKKDMLTILQKFALSVVISPMDS